MGYALCLDHLADESRLLAGKQPYYRILFTERFSLVLSLVREIEGDT